MSLNRIGTPLQLLLQVACLIAIISGKTLSNMVLIPMLIGAIMQSIYTMYYTKEINKDEE